MTELRRYSWRRRVFALAAPIILGNLTQPLLSFVNTVLSGHLSSRGVLGGVALAGVFFNFIFWGFGFLRMGASGLVAQSFGAGDWRGMRLTVQRYLATAAIIGVLVALLGHPLINFSISLLGGKGDVRTIAVTFCSIGIWAAPAVLTNYVITGTLYGLQRMKISLVMQTIINALNGGISIFFVCHMHWGAAGLAWANLIADYSGLIFGAVVMALLKPRLFGDVHFAELFDAKEMTRLVSLNRDLFIRTFLLIFSLAWMARCGAIQGDLPLAANTLLLNISSFATYGMDGFANAAEALSGQAIGARRRTDFDGVVYAAAFWSAGIALIYAAIYGVFANSIIALMTNHADIRLYASKYWQWAALFPLASIAAFLIDGIYIGATRTRELRNCMTISALYFILASMAMQHFWGNQGLWASFISFMFIRGATLAFTWRKVVGGITWAKQEQPA